MEELLTRGRIYGYRYRPQGDLKAKPISEYKGKCIEGKAFQVMIDNNLCFDIALYPYELVTYGETGQVCQNWMQYRLIKKYLEELTEELITLGKNQEERSKCIPAIQPIANKDLKRTASGYGVRIDPIYRTPRFHSGMDFSAKVGTEVYATGDGVVTFAAWKQGYGNCLMINHGHGFQTLYGHLSKFRARVGQKVKRGEVIGEVGNTGKSTGPHLHYEVIVRGKYDNPSKYYYMDLTPEEYDRMIQIAENHGQVMD